MQVQREDLFKTFDHKDWAKGSAHISSINWYYCNPFLVTLNSVSNGCAVSPFFMHSTVLKAAVLNSAGLILIGELSITLWKKQFIMVWIQGKISAALSNQSTLRRLSIVLAFTSAGLQVEVKSSICITFWKLFRRLKLSALVWLQSPLCSSPIIHKAN